MFMRWFLFVCFFFHGWWVANVRVRMVLMSCHGISYAQFRASVLTKVEWTVLVLCMVLLYTWFLCCIHFQIYYIKTKILAGMKKRINGCLSIVTFIRYSNQCTCFNIYFFIILLLVRYVNTISALDHTYGCSNIRWKLLA